MKVVIWFSSLNNRDDWEHGLLHMCVRACVCVFTLISFHLELHSHVFYFSFWDRLSPSCWAAWRYLNLWCSWLLPRLLGLQMYTTMPSYHDLSVVQVLFMERRQMGGATQAELDSFQTKNLNILVAYKNTDHRSINILYMEVKPKNSDSKALGKCCFGNFFHWSLTSCSCPLHFSFFNIFNIWLAFTVFHS